MCVCVGGGAGTQCLGLTRAATRLLRMVESVELIQGSSRKLPLGPPASLGCWHVPPAMSTLPPLKRTVPPPLHLSPAKQALRLWSELLMTENKAPLVALQPLLLFSDCPPAPKCMATAHDQGAQLWAGSVTLSSQAP